MTLCMAAGCVEGSDHEPRIIICADRRAEIGWAGGDVLFKLNWGADYWPALIAGSVSSAEDLLATCRSVLDSDQFTAQNVFDKLTEASNAHRRKLSERLVASSLGISLDRFLKEGEKELTPEVRSRVFNRLMALTFDCEVLIVGFIDSDPQIFQIDELGTVTVHQNFGAIGTGAVIASSSLYQRQHNRYFPLEVTLYKLYEAASLARIAPGVGEIDDFIIISPGRPMKNRITTSKCATTLQAMFQKFGPKPITAFPVLDDSCIERITPDEADETTKKPEQLAGKVGNPT